MFNLNCIILGLKLCEGLLLHIHGVDPGLDGFLLDHHSLLQLGDLLVLDVKVLFQLPQLLHILLERPQLLELMVLNYDPVVERVDLLLL